MHAILQTDVRSVHAQPHGKWGCQADRSEEGQQVETPAACMQMLQSGVRRHLMAGILGAWTPDDGR